MAIPPHIPVETHETQPQHASPVVYAVVSLVVGALSGFVASLVYTAYGPSSRPIISSETRIERVPEIIEERFVKNAQESAAAFYGDKIDQPLGFGFAITGDGWFVASAGAAKAKKVVIHPTALGAVEKIISDPSSNLIFVKTAVKDARLLAYGSLDVLARGTKLAIVLPQTAIPVTLQDVRVCITDHCPTEQGDKISYAATIVETISQFAVDGAPVITQQGELVGVAERIQNRIVIIPITALRPGFESTFATGTAQRPNFPVRVINATRWAVGDANGKLLQQGMLVENTGGVAELKEGDIITHIERQPIEATTTLFGLVNQVYSLGKATFTVQRKGAVMDIVVPFKR